MLHLDATRTAAASCVPKSVGYVSVALELITRAEKAPVDIFVAPDQAVPPQLYCRTGLALDHRQLLSLADIGVSDFYVRLGDVRPFGEYLREAYLNGRRTVTVAEQFSAMQVVVAAEIEHAARLLDCSKFVCLAANIGRWSSSQQPPPFRDRVKELRRVKASELRRHPENWRLHNDGQRNALAAMIEDVGFATAALAFENSQGELQLIDGHLRTDLASRHRL